MLATLVTLLVFVPTRTTLAQDNILSLRNYIQTGSSIGEGGTELFEYQGVTYLISVVPVVVSSKSEIQCKTVGNAKAKKEMLGYINGTDITSSTILTYSETSTTTLEGTKVECKQEYIESIKESPRNLKNYPKPLYPEIPPLTLVSILPTSSAMCMWANRFLCRTASINGGANLFIFCSLGGTQFCCWCVVYDTKIAA